MKTANAPTSVEMWGNGEIRLCSSTGGQGSVLFFPARIPNQQRAKGKLLMGNLDLG
jgi:hypothetical protein